MANQYATSVPSKRLQVGILSTDSSFSLNNILSWEGLVDGTTALTSADFGTRAFGCFRNATNTQIEFFEWDPTTIASSSITIIARGLAYTGATVDGAVDKYNWNANETIVELGGTVPQLFEQYLDKTSDQTLAGIVTFTQSPIVPLTPTGSTQAASKGYVDLVAGGLSVTDQLLMDATAGETLAAGNLCYFKESDQRWWKTDADALATSQNITLGFAQGTATAGNSVTILKGGLEKNLTGMTAGAKYYVGNTAGAISTTPGTLQRFIGWARSTTVFIFAPNDLESNLLFDTAGENLVAGNLVYFKESDQKWWKTDADALATSVGVRIGIAQETILADAAGVFRIGGIDRTQTGMTAGAKYYVSNTAAGITSTIGTFQRFVGTALSTAELLLDTSSPYSIDQTGRQIYAATATGNDTYTATMTPTLKGYYDGLMVNIKVDVANNGASSLNIDGLGAITLKKRHDQDTETGDVEANEIITLIYNSTGPKFQILELASEAVTYMNGITTRAGDAASATQNIAHGLGKPPKYVRITVTYSDVGNKNMSSSTGVYNGTTTSMVYHTSSMAGTTAASTGQSSTNIAAAYRTGGTTGNQVATVATDATNITLSWTLTNTMTSDSMFIMWEAWA